MERWRPHPLLSWLIRATVILVPVIAAVAVAVVASRLLSEPEGLAELAAWWAVVVGSSIAVLVLLRTVGRRVLPLSILLRLSLVFPDRAPSRFRTAMRAWSTSRLVADVRNARYHGLSDDTTSAAELLLALIASLGRHDPRTKGHSARTRAYTDVLAEELGIEGRERERLRWAALLHDVGKLEVPVSILRKDERPDRDEWRVLHRHPEIGHQLTEPLHSFLGDWAMTILHHHERWDGTGYPAGLVGEEICYGARIVAVADAFDAMTAVRSYQPPRPADVVRRELAYRAGNQFDPKVVRALLNVSIGRIRRIMGPLTILAQIPFIGGLRRVGQTAGTMAAAAAGLVALAMGGVADMPTGPGQQAEVLGVTIDSTVIVIDVAGEGAASGVDPASISVLTPPELGSAEAMADGTIRYQAPAGITGTDRFEYQVCRSGECTVEAIEMSLDASGSVAITAAAPGVAARYADGSTVAAVTGSAAGTGTGPAADQEPSANAAGTGTSARAGAATRSPEPDETSPTSSTTTTATTAPTTTTTTVPPATTTSTTTTTARVPRTTTTTTVPPATTTSTTTTVPPTTTTTTSTTTTVPPTTTTSTTTTTTTVPPPTTSSTTTTSTTTTVPPTTTTTTTVPPPTTTTTTTTVPPPTTTTTTVPPPTTTTTTVPPPTTPVAVDDVATTAEDEAVLIDVLANDEQVDLADATITIESNPKDGTATVEGLMVRYQPAPDFNGTDDFDYEVCSPPGECDRARVDVTVTPVNDAPVAQPDTRQARVGEPEVVDVLGNDFDVDGDDLSIVSFDSGSALGGSIVRDDRGNSDPTDDRLVYTSAPGWDGSDDQFTYVVGDGNGGTATGVVTMTGDASSDAAMGWLLSWLYVGLWTP